MHLSDNIEEFLYFPKKLYSSDPFYTTKSEDISDCERLFIVKDDDNILARAGLIKPSPELSAPVKDKEIGYIGFFEAENNIEAVKFLFSAIKKCAYNQGYNYLIGPINGSTWKKYRVTLPSSNPPFLMDNYNMSYYAQLFEESGFETIADYKSSICRNLDKDYSRLEKFSKIFVEKKIKIRTFDSSNFEKDIKKIYDVSIKSFVNNFLYTPIDFEDFYKMYEPYKNFLNPETVLIAENEKDEPIAFIFGIDDLYNKTEKTLIIKTLAQITDYKYRGIGSYLTEYMHKKAYTSGYKAVIHALMHKSNVSANILSGEIYHEYKLYGTEI